jgi:hypothetical protein
MSETRQSKTRREYSWHQIHKLAPVGMQGTLVFPNGIGASPLVSPDDQKFSFRVDGNVHLGNGKAGASTKPYTEAIVAMPDGTEIDVLIGGFDCFVRSSGDKLLLDGPKWDIGLLEHYYSDAEIDEATPSQKKFMQARLASIDPEILALMEKTSAAASDAADAADAVNQGLASATDKAELSKTLINIMDTMPDVERSVDAE